MKNSEFLINDIYWTIQGEGKNSGRRALFIRMPFCSLSCNWCDTNYSSYKSYSHRDILDIIESETGRFAVLSGGEPTINSQISLIIGILKDNGFEIAIETNGLHPIPDGVDFVTVSPKRDSKDIYNKEYFIHTDAYKKANEFKYIVDDDFNFSIFDEHKYKDDCYYLLSPEYSNMKDNLKKIISYIKINPRWNVSLQTHKWMGIN